MFSSVDMFQRGGSRKDILRMQSQQEPCLEDLLLNLYWCTYVYNQQGKDLQIESFQYMGIPDLLTSLLRNLHAGQEATDIRTGHGTGSKLGKEYTNTVYCHPVHLYAEYIMWNAGLDEAQAGIKTVGRNINNLRYADDTTLMAESGEELETLAESEREE